MSTIFCADYIVKIKCTDAVSNLLQRLQRHPPSVYKLMKEEDHYLKGGAGYFGKRKWREKWPEKRKSIKN